MISGIGCPAKFALRRQQRKPRNAPMTADVGVLKAIIAVAPCAESQRLLGVSADGGMNPPRRHNHHIARACLNREAPSGVILPRFLHINHSFARPNLIDLRRRPPAMRGNLMNMPLTADGFIAQLPGGIRHDAIEEHPLLHGGQVLLAPDVHHDGIDVFRPIAIRVAKALADAVELAELRAFIEAVRPQPEALIHRQRRNIESGVKIKFHGVFPLLKIPFRLNKMVAA